MVWDWLKSKMGYRGMCWIGIHDQEKEGSFVYAESGMEITFSNWPSGQPRSYLGKDCVEMGNSGYWYNQECHSTVFQFVCEAPIKHVFE